MKLATRYQRSYLASTLIVFTLASVAFYVLLHRVLLFQMDEDLEIEQHEIETYVSRYQALPQMVLPVEDQIVHYEKAAFPQAKPAFTTKELWDEAEHEKGAFRQLQFTVKVGPDWYRASVSKSLEAVNGLTKQIGLIALGISVLLLLLLFVLNRFVLRKLWRPFYNTIDQLKTFELESNRELHLPAVSTEEFALLNTTLKTVSGRAVKDYKLLKEFTENASHELQTPLAIIRSKLDLLIQDEALSGNQSKLVQDAYQALARMTYLNQSLLELAKIEGGQYNERTTLDMKALLSEKLLLLEELFQSKEIEVSQNLEASAVWIHPVLADMLLNNLLINAIHHNKDKGKIEIYLKAGSLTVCNTSDLPVLEPQQAFNRFSKISNSSGGTGLGLAISQQICTSTGCLLDYKFERGLHCFVVTWEKQNTP